MLSVIIVDYIIAILIERSKAGSSNNSKIYLLIGILFPIVLLFIFKYFNFFNQTISQIAGFFMLNYPAQILNIIVPAVSYTHLTLPTIYSV